MTALWTQAKVWLWSAVVALGATLIAFVYALGRRSRENEQLRERVRGAGVRADAEDIANASADPASELRRRGWVRGMETDQDQR